MAIADPAPAAVCKKTVIPLRFLAWLFLVYGCVHVVGYYVYLGLEAVCPFEGSDLDGPFQLFNALRRMADGQTPGVDFQYFHGLGIPLVHYPLFALFGKGMLASEISRQLTSPILLVIALAILGRVLSRSVKDVVFFAFSALLAMYLFCPEIVVPIQNLIGIRSMAPILLFAVLLGDHRGRQKALLKGAVLALSLLLSTEQGMALIAAYAACFVFARLVYRKQSPWQEVADFALSLVTAAAGYLVALWLICGWEGAGGALRFALVSLPEDQFWFFGVPPAPFISDWADLLTRDRLWRRLAIGGVVTGIVVVKFLRARPQRTCTSPHFAYLVLTIYGLATLAACFGICARSYTIPIKRVWVLIALTAGCQWALRRGLRESWLGYLDRLASFKARMAAVALLLIASFAMLNLYGKFRRLGAPRLGPHRLARLDALTRTIDRLHASQRPPTIWSTYAGMIENHYGIFHPHTDYIIHVLGPKKRREYVDRFRRLPPEFVLTFRNSVEWEEWLRTTNWEFYELLVLNYKIVGNSDLHLVWCRKDAAWREPGPLTEFGDAGKTSGEWQVPQELLDGGGGGIVVAELQYRVHNPWRRLPIFGQSPRYLVSIENARNELPISVPPYQDRVRIPFFLAPTASTEAAPPRFKAEVKGLLPGVDFEITGVAFRKLAAGEVEEAFFGTTGRPDGPK